MVEEACEFASSRKTLAEMAFAAAVDQESLRLKKREHLQKFDCLLFVDCLKSVGLSCICDCLICACADLAFAAAVDQETLFPLH